MTLSDVRARFRRGFARMWEWLKKRFTWKRNENFAAWGSEPRDAAHALYRERFERFAEGMPHLPRTKTNETTEAFLAVSQTAQMLHEYGDDPIRVPETGRIIRPEDRLAAFGAVGQPAPFMGSLGSSASLWIVAAGLVVCGSGWVTNEISSANYKAERAAHSVTKNEYAMLARANESLRDTNAELSRLVTAADTQTRQTAEMVEQERARRIRAEREAQRVRDEQARAARHAPSVNYGFGSVPDAPVQPGAADAGGGAAARRNPS